MKSVVLMLIVVMRMIKIRDVVSQRVKVKPVKMMVMTVMMLKGQRRQRDVRNELNFLGSHSDWQY